MIYKFNIYLIIFLIISGCAGNKKTVVSAETNSGDTVNISANSEKLAGIEISSLIIKTVSDELVVTGKIDVPPQNLVSVSVPLGGYLKHTELLPGLRVKKGSVIAVLEDKQYIELQENYLTCTYSYKLSETEYKRQELLFKEKATSERAYIQAKTEWEEQRIKVQSLREKLRLININADQLTADNISGSVKIYSPIEGVVSKVLVNMGKYVNPSEILFELINPEDIHLNLSVLEKNIAQLYMGQRVIATTNHKPDKPYECDIILISQDLNDGIFAQVHCHFKNYDPALLPGMYMNAKILSKPRDAWMIPSEAIVRLGDQEIIFIKQKPGKYIMTEVKTGIIQNGFTELIVNEAISGIVVKGSYDLLMSLKNKGEE